MKNTFRIAMGLLTIPLVALIVSSAGMVNFVQYDIRSLVEQHLVKYPFICESAIHEAGYGRIALGSVGLLILFIPFRQRLPWAWTSLAILFLYHLPVFVFPPGTHLPPGWHALKEMMLRPEFRMMLLNLLFPAFLIVGLTISLPSFLSSAQRNVDPSTG